MHAANQRQQQRRTWGQWRRPSALPTRHQDLGRSPSAHTHPPPARSSCKIGKQSIRGHNSLRSRLAQQAAGMALRCLMRVQSRTMRLRGCRKGVQDCSRGAVHHLADAGVLVDGCQELLRLLVLHEPKPAVSAAAPWALHSIRTEAAAAVTQQQSGGDVSASPCRLARTRRPRRRGRTASC